MSTTGKKLTLLFIGITISVFLFFSVFNTKSTRSVAEGVYAPLLGIKDELTGHNVTLSDLENKVVFVNFWASWCPPCKEEMPSVESLFKNMRGNGNFQMITILYKDPYQNGTAYMNQNGYTFPVYSDNTGTAARKFGVTGVPETYVIDKKGTLRKRVIGPAEWNSPDVKDFLNALLNE